MIDEVADAFERNDYRTAARLLKQLVKQEPKNPWVQLYVGRLHEATGKLESAEKVYRQLLRGTTNQKIMSQARQGLGRLEQMEKERRRQAIAQATSDPNSGELGVLILEPIATEAKTAAVPKFARIMQIDAYTARLQLPSRGWRLYRTGPVGELNYYVSSLRDASIPCFAAMLADIRKINVFNVHHFSEGSQTSQATVVCQNAQGMLGSFTFNWSEVSQRVEGLLPLFEEVVDRDARRKLQRKTQTLDYVQFATYIYPGEIVFYGCAIAAINSSRESPFLPNPCKTILESLKRLPSIKAPHERTGITSSISSTPNYLALPSDRISKPLLKPRLTLKKC
jgi:hypothetical protein